LSARIEASSVRYIKLGPKGAWEKHCIEEGTLRFGHREVPHALALTRDRESIRAHLLPLGYDATAASDKAREILDFYDQDETALWVTFYAGKLWWCFADAQVQELGPDSPLGSRMRRALGGWSSVSAAGQPLEMNALSGRLTRTAAYRKTTCRIVEAAPYLLARLNDETEPEVAALTSARTALLSALVAVIRRLTWQDFELLVDLIFTASGWRRTGAVGGVQKTVDIELELPTTGERAFVQVKSETSPAEFRTYRDALAEREEGRMFYAYHSGKIGVEEVGEEITILGPERIAEMTVSAGLLDWIIRRGS
jgi:hypothetical protein